MTRPRVPIDDARELRLAGSITRVVLLVVLLVVLAPAVVRVGDVFAVPAVTLMLLGAIVVVIVSLAYWLVTVGAPARWLSYRLRFTPDRVVIATATIAVIGCGIGLVSFRSGIRHPRSALAQFDLRAANTAVRLSGESHLMQSLNSAGIRSMLVLGGMIVLAGIAGGALRSAALLAATMAVGGVLVEFLKMNPASPVATLGNITRATSSWPSGHAAFQGSLALGFVLWWWAAGLPRPSIVAAIVVPLALLVGYSRAFLGIHYLSEVLSGWLVATAAAAVVLLVDRIVVPRLGVPTPTKRWPVIAAGIAALLVTGVAVHSVHRFHDRGPGDFGRFEPGGGFRGLSLAGDPTPLASAEPAAVLGPLPRFSETLLGTRAQPLNVVVVARDPDLRAAFATAGWSEVAPLTPKRLAPDFWRGITGGIDRDAPVAPMFLDTRAADLVVQRPDRSSSVAAEQADVWELPAVTPSGCYVVGITAARFDRSSWSWHTLFPQRHLSPAVDAEREALAGALAAAGQFEDLGRFDFVAPLHGSSPSGAYTTDGKVALLRQPGCTTPGS